MAVAGEPAARSAAPWWREGGIARDADRHNGSARLGTSDALAERTTRPGFPGRATLRASGSDLPVIDSTLVGAASPDPRIFHAILARAGPDPHATVHVGDTLANDVAGARAAGITPIHFDPLRSCRAPDHRQVRSLPGIWRHVQCP